MIIARGIARIKPAKNERRTINVRFGFAFFTAGSAVSSILISNFSLASSILAISNCCLKICKQLDFFFNSTLEPISHHL